MTANERKHRRKRNQRKSTGIIEGCQIAPSPTESNVLQLPHDSGDIRRSKSKLLRENRKLKVEIQKLKFQIDGMKKQHKRKIDEMNQDMEDPQSPGAMGSDENSHTEQCEADDERPRRKIKRKKKKSMRWRSEMEEEEKEVSSEEQQQQCTNTDWPTDFNNRPTECNNGPSECNNGPSECNGRPTDNDVTVSCPPLLCRSVRVGSHHMYPSYAAGKHILRPVYVSMDSISFEAPVVSDENKMVNVILKPADITQMMIHFGKCLPVLYIYTTEEFAEAVRKSLDMSSDFPYYGPLSNNERENKITLLFDSVNDGQRNFLRHQFLNKEKIKEIDQKTANLILINSVLTKDECMKRKVVHNPPPQQHSNQSHILPLTRENVLAFDKNNALEAAHE